MAKRKIQVAGISTSNKRSREAVPEVPVDEQHNSVDHEDDDSNQEEDDDDESDTNDDLLQPQPLSKVIDTSTLTSLSTKSDQSGLLYLSRIPPGMGPGKVRHLLSQWGNVGRIFLARHENEDEMSTTNNTKKRKKKKEKHQKHRFKEGWVEMEDKKVARTLAGMLNTRPIGGKASDPFCQDLWSLTYLPRFKWTHLSDQIASERASRIQRMRQTIEASKRDQTWYLDMVERRRVQTKISEKKSLNAKQQGDTEKVTQKEDVKSTRLKLYKQREALTDDQVYSKQHDKHQAGDQKLQSVLANLF